MPIGFAFESENENPAQLHKIKVNILVQRAQNENLQSTMKYATKESLLSSPEKKKVSPIIPAYADIHTRYVATEYRRIGYSL